MTKRRKIKRNRHNRKHGRGLEKKGINYVEITKELSG